MFGLFKRRPGFFPTPQRQRQIFRYWDGQRLRLADPIEALQKINTHPQYNYRVHPKLVDQGDPEAIQVTCLAVRDAFGVSAFDPDAAVGLTVLETLELLAAFCLYLDGLKKSTNVNPMSPEPMESTSSESGEPITSDTSATG